MPALRGASWQRVLVAPVVFRHRAFVVPDPFEVSGDLAFGIRVPTQAPPKTCASEVFSEVFCSFGASAPDASRRHTTMRPCVVQLLVQGGHIAAKRPPQAQMWTKYVRIGMLRQRRTRPLVGQLGGNRLLYPRCCRVERHRVDLCVGLVNPPSGTRLVRILGRHRLALCTSRGGRRDQAWHCRYCRARASNLVQIWPTMAYFGADRVRIRSRALKHCSNAIGADWTRIS